MSKVLATTSLPCMPIGTAYHTLFLSGAKLYLCEHKAGYGEQRRESVSPSDFSKDIHSLIKIYFKEAEDE